MKDGKRYLMNFFFLLPILGIFALQIICDPISRWPKLVVFTISMITSLINRKWGIAFVIISMGWWETLIMSLGYPNQFLIEPIILGCIVVHLMTNNLSAKVMIRAMGHPLVIAMCTLIIYIGCSELLEIAQLQQFSYEGLPVKKYLSMIGRHIGNWSVTTNPIHGLSLVLAYLYQVIFILILLNIIHRDVVSPAFIFDCLGASIVVPVAAAIGQIAWQDGSLDRIAVHFGGSFQNGNHLSFFSGIIVITSLYRIWEMRRYKPGWSIFLLIFASIGLFLGASRTAMIGLFLGLMSAVAIYFGGWLQSTVSFKKVRQDKFISANWVVGCGLFALVSALMIHNFSWLQISLSDSENLHRFLDLLPIPNNRLHNYFLSLLASVHLPLTGVGAGLLFRKFGAMYETHSTFLWLVESFGFVIASLVVGWFLWGLIGLVRGSSNLAARMCACVLAVYLSFSFLPDNYLSYRSLLTAVGVSLTALYSLIGEQVMRPNKSALLGSLILVGVSMVFLIISPISKPLADQVWHFEPNASSPTGMSRWSGPFLSMKPTSNKCMRRWIYPIFPRGSTEVFFGRMIDQEKIWSLSTLHDYLRYAARNEEGKLTFANGQWQSLCACLGTDQSSPGEIYMMAINGEYLSLSRHNYGNDDRFITFGQTKATLHNQSEIKSNPSLCDHTMYF